MTLTHTKKEWRMGRRKAGMNEWTKLERQKMERKKEGRTERRGRRVEGKPEWKENEKLKQKVGKHIDRKTERKEWMKQ